MLVAVAVEPAHTAKLLVRDRQMVEVDAQAPAEEQILLDSRAVGFRGPRADVQP